MAALPLLATCAYPSHPAERPARDGRSFGVYKGSFLGRAGQGGRFRLLLFAELPDRLHAEVLGPVGGPRLILDGGQGRLSVALVDERVAYLGDSGAETLGKAIGARVSLASLVGALLTGVAGDAAEVVMERRPPERPGLPDTFEIRSNDRVLRIERKGKERIRGAGASLGSGAPPEGFSVLALGDLDLGEDESLLDRETGS